MPSNSDSISSLDDRLLETLERLLALTAPEIRPTLDQASTWAAEAVDVFLYEAEKESLVALGTSETPLGHTQQHGLYRSEWSDE
jgi:two-component system, OmpR family, sensor kinase